MITYNTQLKIANSHIYPSCLSCDALTLPRLSKLCVCRGGGGGGGGGRYGGREKEEVKKNPKKP